MNAEKRALKGSAAASRVQNGGHALCRAAELEARR